MNYLLLHLAVHPRAQQAEALDRYQAAVVRRVRVPNRRTVQPHDGVLAASWTYALDGMEHLAAPERDLQHRIVRLHLHVVQAQRFEEVLDVDQKLLIAAKLRDVPDRNFKNGGKTSRESNYRLGRFGSGSLGS